MTPDRSKVYVRDEQFAWIPATIIDKDEGRVKVRIDLSLDWERTTCTTHITKKLELNGQERWVELNEYYNDLLPLQNDKAVRDIAELPNLHEAAVLYQIKNRHALKQPYTRVGEIIIAVNPCEWMPELYSLEQQRIYARHFVWQGE
jgi:myosin-5